MKKRRIVIGTKIHSLIDRDIHYVSANKCCELYGFNKEECYLIEANRHFTTDFYFFYVVDYLFRGIDMRLPIYLPRYLGDYKHSKLKIWWQEFRCRHKKWLGIPKEALFLIYERN